MVGLVVALCLTAADVGAAEQPLDAGVEPADLEQADGGLPADAPAEKPLAAAAAGEVAAPAQGFVKGELSVYLGADRLVVKNNRIGISAGADFLDQTLYLLVNPMVDLRFLDGKLGIGLVAPLRFEMFSLANDPATGSPYQAKNLGHLRTEDWNSFHDFGRILNYVTYGRKEDDLYISAGQRYASSIGHGAIQRRYAPNLDIDYPRASVEVDWYNQYAGFELFANDILEWNQLSGIVFVKPLAFFNKENLLTSSLSIGVSGGLDWKAPWQLQSDPVTGARLLDADGRLRSTYRAVKLVGVDAELKVVKTANVDLKPYVDYSLLIDGDSGLTAGVLGRFNVGTKVVHAFRAVAEFRYLGSRYAPGWFDTFYEVERFVFRDTGRDANGFAQFQTKYDYVQNVGLGRRFGYYLEASWGIPGKVGVTLAFEGATGPEADQQRNLVAHLEVPVLDFLQVFGSYYKRGLTSFADFGKFDEKTVLYAGARLKILPILFLNGRVYKTFRMDPAQQRYSNQIGFAVDLEVGYEFAWPKQAPPPVAEASSQGNTPR